MTFWATEGGLFAFACYVREQKLKRKPIDRRKAGKKSSRALPRLTNSEEFAVFFKQNIRQDKWTRDSIELILRKTVAKQRIAIYKINELTSLFNLLSMNEKKLRVAKVT